MWLIFLKFLYIPHKNDITTFLKRFINKFLGHLLIELFLF